MVKCRMSLEQDNLPASSPDSCPFLTDPHESMKDNIVRWSAEALIFLGVIIWVIAALITQNLFLLSGIPLLARELAYAFRKMIDSLFLVNREKEGQHNGLKYCSCPVETQCPRRTLVPTK